MSMRYKGGVLSATPPTVTTSAAKGLWTMQQQLFYKAAGLWPSPTLPVYVYQAFTSSGTWTCPTGVTEVDILVVAGGGGGVGAYPGNAQGSGGGGAGGVIYKTGHSVTAGTSYTITVGGGAAKRTASTTGIVGNPGSDSVFGSNVIVSKGGGGGGFYTNGAQGGSGGGTAGES